MQLYFVSSWICMTAFNQDFLKKYKHIDDLEMFHILMPLSLSQGCLTDAKVQHNLASVGGYVPAHNPDWHCEGGINGKSCSQESLNLLDTVYVSRVSPLQSSLFQSFWLWLRRRLTGFFRVLHPASRSPPPIYWQSSLSSSLNLASTMQVLAGMKDSGDGCLSSSTGV